MSRFVQEISGELGDYWKRSAEKELAKVQADLDSGAITIDQHGIARNCIGRVLMDDMLEKVMMLTDKVSKAATQAARAAETEAVLEAYRQHQSPPDAEELAEMRAAFDEGTVVADVITGKKIQL